jgi:hypothetical protein
MDKVRSAAGYCLLLALALGWSRFGGCRTCAIGGCFDQSRG